MNSLAAILLASAVSAAAGHPRFVVVDQSTLDEVPGLRLITVRDPALNSCYLIIRDDPARRAGGGTSYAPDVDQARALRDRRLVELLQAFEQDRAAIPGTISPNPYKYEWQAATAQFEFALAVIAREFTRLEEELDRVSGVSPATVAAMPVPCMNSGALPKP